MCTYVYKIREASWFGIKKEIDVLRIGRVWLKAKEVRGKLASRRRCWRVDWSAYGDQSGGVSSRNRGELEPLKNQAAYPNTRRFAMTRKLGAYHTLFWAYFPLERCRLAYVTIPRIFQSHLFHLGLLFFQPIFACVSCY